MAIIYNKTYRIRSHAGEGLYLRLAAGTQSVALHKQLQTTAWNDTNLSYRWIIKNVPDIKIVTVINESYALNFNPSHTARRADIYPYSNSDSYTSLTLESVNSNNNTYRIKITVDGTVYYLTSGSKTSVSFTTWEPASGGDNQKWMFEEIKNFTYPTTSRTLAQAYSTNHPGIDVAGVNGVTPIYAFADGTVAYKQTYEDNWHPDNDPDGLDGNSMESMGNMIAINHNNPDSSIMAGAYARTIYMHMYAPSTLANGSQVKKGDILGYIGNTGRSSGPHLHFCLSVGNLSAMAPGEIGWISIYSTLPNKNAVMEYLPEYEA